MQSGESAPPDAARHGGSGGSCLVRDGSVRSHTQLAATASVAMPALAGEVRRAAVRLRAQMAAHPQGLLS